MNRERQGIPRCWLMQPPAGDHPSNGETSWESYWERLQDTQQLFREQSEEYCRNLDSIGGLHPAMRVLDFGCGFGYVAKLLGRRVREVAVWDSSANMRCHARFNLKDEINVRFVDLSNTTAAAQPLQFDLILVNSVAQYMTCGELSAWLYRWQTMLYPGGRIIVSDLIPSNYAAIQDILDLVRFSSKRGFLFRAAWQACSEIWRYSRVRKLRPLSRIGKEELTRRAADAGLTVQYLPVNLTHFKKRLSAVLSKAEGY